MPNAVKVILSIAALACCAGLFGQQPKILSEEKISAAEFVERNRDLKKAAESLVNSAVAEYESRGGDLGLAEEKLWYGKFLAHLDKSGAKFPDPLLELFANDAGLTVEFARTLSPLDNIPVAFKILCDIYADSSADFAEFSRLACAIAVVFDTPAPKSWPHSQVSPKVLKRDMGDPVKAFKTHIDSRRRGKFLLKTEKLEIEELKYLVASLADDADRDWVFKNVTFTINTLPKLYSSVEYSHGRINAKQFDWPGTDYSLKSIKKEGGICVDQAYYTAEAAKIRGLPAFIFSGAGSDGFHAWVAYMQKSGKWNFDVGRYASAKFVTGHTLDPQTWKPASDHALNSMREAFRESQKYRTNLIHAAFAKLYAGSGDFAKSEKAARAAIASDPRNAEAWDALILALEKSGAGRKALIDAYQSAVKAFGRYPDVEAQYRRRLIKLIEGDDPALARRISTQMISKTKTQRPDIAMEFARRAVEKDIESDNLDRLDTNYKTLLGMFKGNAAIAVNGITMPVLNKLIKEDKMQKCDAIIKATRQVLKAKGDSNVGAALDSIESQLEAIRSRLQK